MLSLLEDIIEESSEEFVGVLSGILISGVISFYIGHILVNIPGRYILIFNDYPLISIINHSELNRDVCSAGDIKESGVPSVGHATRSLRSDRQIDIVPRLEHFYDRIRQ